MHSWHSGENGSIQLLAALSIPFAAECKFTHPKEKYGTRIRNIFNMPSREEAESMLKKTIEKYENKTSGFAEWIEHEIPEGLTVFNLVPDSIGVRRKLRTANMIEFQNKELKKRTRCIKLFPNRESLLRIATALLIELDETWLSESKRYI